MKQINYSKSNPAQFEKNYPDLLEIKSIRMVKGNIENINSLPNDKRYSHIIHAATDSTLGPQLNPIVRYKQIVNGTSNLLEFAVTNKAERFLLTSSGGIYGPQPDEIDFISEDYLGSPLLTEVSAAYSHGKRAADIYVPYIQNHLLILRLHVVYLRRSRSTI